MFASRLYNYGRYGLYDMRSMTWLGQKMLEKFCRGESRCTTLLVSTMDSGMTYLWTDASGLSVRFFEATKSYAKPALEQPLPG